MTRVAVVCAALLPVLALAGDSQDLSSMTLEQLMDLRVEGAALHSQTLEDAPASVTIITAEQIRRFGYRTLGEALSSARGFYLNNNRTYRTAGVRGFNLPGDYGNRLLVMVNGHNMADNIFDSMLWFGVDFPIDMTLVKQIEIIRGPSSALYGSNGIFATINIITKTPDGAGPASVITDFGSFGEKKGQVMGTVPVGKSAKALLSGSVFNNGGESPLDFPGLGEAIRMDGEKGYHFFANFVWRNWNVTAVASDRNKIQPVSWGDTVFNDRGTHLVENANYVEAAYTRELRGGILRWSTFYNSDHLGGRFDYPLGEGIVEDNRTFSWGDWIGSRLTYRFDPRYLGTLTAGIEGQVDLRTHQGSKDVAPVPQVFVDIDRRDRSLALFLQDERKLSRSWKLDLGLRLDESSYRQSFLSPRGALIFQPSDPWSFKFLYGRAFRNPSAFDLFYEDGLAAAANPDARAEKADTFEIDVERKIGKRTKLVAAGYGYRLRDFLEGVYNSHGLIETQNQGMLHAQGFEIEIDHRPTTSIEMTGSYAFQRSTDELEDAQLENSPQHLAKFRLAVPLGRRFEASTGMQYYSSRLTLSELPLRPVYLADFTVTTRRLLPNLDVQFGMRNAFDRNYSDPVALNPVVESMRQPGRSFFVRLVGHVAQ